MSRIYFKIQCNFKNPNNKKKTYESLWEQGLDYSYVPETLGQDKILKSFAI